MPYLPSVGYVSTSAFYVVLMFGTAIWSSTSGFSKLFYQEAPEPFRCPLLQGNSVGGWRQALPPGLSEPWLPVRHSSSVVHPCPLRPLPHVRQARSVTRLPLPSWHTALWCSTRQCCATSTVCIDKHLQRQAGGSTPSANSTHVKAGA
jgi:hypothetical protein